MENNKIRWITQSALLIALLVGWQWGSRTLFPTTTLVTGSGINFILIIAVASCSLPVGVSVAAISPVMAQIIGIAPPFWVLVPITATANIVLVLAWHFIGKRRFGNAPLLVSQIAALAIGATAKFAVLYLGVVHILVHTLEILPAPLSIPFSFPQLFTAGIGGTLALAVIPVLNKAIGSASK
ncbi:MAG: hypothetical protein FWH07_04350 [Oscillospiraceae bacterium]|nr:hypothetical protein [Oscillospiraceae bacterium]